MKNGYYWIQQQNKHAEIGYYYAEFDSFRTIGSVGYRKRGYYTVHAPIDVSMLGENPLSAFAERDYGGMKLTPYQWEVIDFLQEYNDSYILRVPQFELQRAVVPWKPDLKKTFNQPPVTALIRKGILLEFEPRKYRLIDTNEGV